MERSGSPASAKRMDATAGVRAESAGSRKLLPALALGTLVILAILPGTRVLLREQIWAQTAWPAGRDLRTDYAAIAASHPRDYQVQLAAGIQETMNSAAEGRSMGDVTALTRMRNRFGDSPSLLANLLRMMTLRTPRGARPEHLLLKANKLPHDFQSRELGKPAVERWLAFDRTAADGERIDPRNAYFPFMRSIGLFALKRDREAIAAIHRAAALPHWDEHIQDEAEGAVRAEALAGAHPTARRRIELASKILFPNYRGLRDSARIATYAAVEAEADGRHEEGLRIRRSVMRCGGAMRAGSENLIGAVVGMAITTISWARPGGAPHAPRRAASENAQSASARRAEEFADYLQRKGERSDIEWLRAELGAHRQLWVVANGHYDVGPFGAPRHLLHSWWAIDQLILANIFWLLALGAAAAILGRSAWARRAQPLPWSARGACAALLAWPAYLSAHNLRPEVDLLIVGAWTPVLALIVYTAVCRRRDLMGLTEACVVTMLALTAGAALAAWQSEPARRMLTSSLGESASGAPFFGLVWGEHPGLFAAATVAVPLMAALALALCSVILRVPAAVGVVRGLRGASVPLACILVMVYAGCLVTTARHEQRLNSLIEGTIEHEGRLMADLLDAEWPGTTP